MSISLKHLMKHVKSRPQTIKLDKLPHSKLWIPNYGEFVSYRNKADGDNWDVLVPGYPPLDKDVQWKSNNLLGVYYLPNGNHKLIIDLLDGPKQQNDWVEQVKFYQEEYEKGNDMYGEVFLTMSHLNI
tara:strand:+ start:275 stop:658 length:384 start_codon:yes stop_codon:yes gene_type:complete